MSLRKMIIRSCNSYVVVMVAWFLDSRDRQLRGIMVLQPLSKMADLTY